MTGSSVKAALAVVIAMSAVAGSARAASIAETAQQIASGMAGTKECQGAAIAIATVGKAGTTQAFAGSVSYADGSSKPADGQTIFEIASLTKTLMGQLFAEAIKANLVKPDDPVAKYLPAGTVVPTFQSGGQTFQIRLIDLATHTSGLPSVPMDAGKPYPTSAMLADLAGMELDRQPGTYWEYSNLGFGVLAVAMETAFKAPIGELLVEHIAKPIGMTRTRVLGDLSDGAVIPIGYGIQGKPASMNNANWPALDGSGGLRATLDDVQRYLTYSMGLAGPVDALALRPMLFDWHTYPTWAGGPPTEQGLGWQRWVPWNNGIDVVWKDGNIPGFSSYIGFSERLGEGAVVLTNRNGCTAQRGVSCVFRSIGEAEGVTFGNAPNCKF